MTEMKLRFHWSLGLLGVALAAAAPPAKPPPEPEETMSLDDVFQAGKELFEEHAPPAIKERFEFPTRANFDEFFARLQRALDQNSLDELAAYEPEARLALKALRTLPGGEENADWLAERLDYIEAAKAVAAPPPPARPTPDRPTPPRPEKQVANVPHYDLWLQRLQSRAAPPGAAKMAARLSGIFAKEGVPPALVWLAEAESTFNPSARSPVGARGLFQLMPATARELGLSTFLPDERTDPEKSAQAAAKMLGQLRARFGDWPLALAAYNAGPGRVQRLVAKHGAKSFAKIAPSLPAETRMYVPKVLATLAVRAGVTPEQLAAKI